MFKAFFDIILYNPILNLLVFFYNAVPGHDFGIAVILLTILLKVVLYPTTKASLKSQKVLQDIQPKLQELRVQYKNEPQKMTQETMKLYKEHKVNPFSSCLPILIQLPIFLALYLVIRDGIGGFDVGRLYPFVAHPESINTTAFFGLVNLANPSIILAVLAGAAQFWQSYLFVRKKGPTVPGAKDENMAAMMNKQMLYLMPIVTVLIGAKLPGALTMYWLVSTLLTVLQQIIMFRPVKNNT